MLHWLWATLAHSVFQYVTKWHKTIQMFAVAMDNVWNSMFVLARMDIMEMVVNISHALGRSQRNPMFALEGDFASLFWKD